MSGIQNLQACRYFRNKAHPELINVAKICGEPYTSVEHLRMRDSGAGGFGFGLPRFRVRAFGFLIWAQNFKDRVQP